MRGPFTIPELRRLASTGEFSRHFHLSTDRVDWERASAHFEEWFRDENLERMLAEKTLGNTNGDEDKDETQSDRSQSGERDDQIDDEWFYTQDGVESELPVTFERLVRLASTGQLRANEFVWTEAMQDWTLAEAVPGLFPGMEKGEPNSQSRLASMEPPSEPAPGAKATAPMAVASFVLGLCGASFLFFIGSICAVVFGHIAIKQISESRGNLGGRGLAISGLVLGYLVLVVASIVVIVLAVLASLNDDPFFPSF